MKPIEKQGGGTSSTASSQAIISNTRGALADTKQKSNPTLPAAIPTKDVKSNNVAKEAHSIASSNTNLQSNTTQKVPAIAGPTVEISAKSKSVGSNVDTNVKQSTTSVPSTTASGSVPSTSARSIKKNPGLTVDTKRSSFSDAASENKSASSVPAGGKITRQSSKKLTAAPPPPQQKTSSGGCFSFICCGGPPKKYKKRTATPHPRQGNNNNNNSNSNNNNMPLNSQNATSKPATLNAPIEKTIVNEDIKSVAASKEAAPTLGKVVVHSASTNSSNKAAIKAQAAIPPSSTTTAPSAGPAGTGITSAVTVSVAAPIVLVAPVALKPSAEPGPSQVAAKLAAIPTLGVVGKSNSGKESLSFSAISTGKSNSAFTEKESSPKLISDDRSIAARAAIEEADATEIDTSSSVNNVYVVNGGENALKKTGRISGGASADGSLLVRYE